MTYELHDTDKYNAILKTFDRGGTILIPGWGSYYIVPVNYYGDGLCIHHSDDYYVYPSNNYDPDDLYYPNNIKTVNYSHEEIIYN